MGDTYLQKFPKSLQEAIAFEYMKRHTDQSNTPEQMTAIYLDAHNRINDELNKTRNSSKPKDKGYQLYDNY